MSKINGNQKYQYNLNIFYNENALSFYLLGVFMSDGHVYNNKKSWICGITSKDRDWLDAISNIICPQLSPKIVKHNGAYEIGFYNKKIAEWLISKGCTERKSLTLKFPEVPNEFLADFLRGFVDGDGTICLNKDKTTVTALCGFYCSSLDFMTSLQTKLLELGYSVKISVDNRKEKSMPSENRIIYSNNPGYRIFITGYRGSEFIQYLYYPEHPLSLNRKANKAIEIIKLYSSKTRKRLVRLTENDVLNIWEMIRNNISYNKIAKKFNVTASNITYIAQGKTWKNSNH